MLWTKYIFKISCLCCVNWLTVLQLLICWVLSKVQIIVFTYQKSSWILGKSLCRPSSEMGKSKNDLQFPPNTPNYTTSVPSWVYNKLFIDIIIWIKVVIKIFNTIYLSRAVIFPSNPSEGMTTFFSCHCWHHESWFQKPWKIVPETAKKGSTSNFCFSTTIRHFRTMFKIINFYAYLNKILYLLIGPGNGSLTHIDITFTTPKFGFS